MAIRCPEPFPAVLSLSSVDYLDPRVCSLRILRAVVAGKDGSFSRRAAMSLLRMSDFPNSHRDLEAVLQDTDEPAEIRAFAALDLGRTGAPEAEEILVRNAGTSDALVLAGIVRALGETGGRASLAVIDRARAHPDAYVKQQASFAAELVAHRLGLGAGERCEAEERTLELPRHDTHTFRIAPAESEDVELCLRALGRRPHGIELTERPAYRVRCGPRSWILLWNRECSGPHAADRLRQARALLGLVAAKEERSGSYALDLLLLSVPGEHGRRISLRACRRNGETVLVGNASGETERLQFELRAVSRPGAFPVEVRGVHEGGTLEVSSAVSGPVAVRSSPVRFEAPDEELTARLPVDSGLAHGEERT